MSKEWTDEELKMAKERVWKNPVWNSPYFANLPIELQCELNDASKLMKELADFATRQGWIHVAINEARAWLDRNKETDK